MGLPDWYVKEIDSWYTQLAMLPTDLDRCCTFFTRTGEDMDGIGFWDTITHKPIHDASCMCGISSPSVFGCGVWKIAELNNCE